MSNDRRAYGNYGRHEMYYCSIYGINVRSDFCITEGIQIDPIDEPDAFVELGTMPDTVKTARDIGHIAEFKDAYDWFYIEGAGYFYIENGDHIVIERTGSDAEFTIMTFLTGLAFALLFTQRGYVPLHGSIIDYNGKGCIISGLSGSGKSSVASELVKRGAMFVADDIGMVDSVNMTVNPGFPVQRLCGDQVERLGLDRNKLEYLGERKNKYARRLEPSEYVYEKRPFDVLIRIQKYDGEELICSEITGSDKLKIIVNNVFCYFFVSNMKMKPESMVSYLRIAEKVKIFSVMRPREKDTLDEVTDFILEKMQRL